jgi:hypothetical protein
MGEVTGVMKVAQARTMACLQQEDSLISGLGNKTS